MLPTKWIKMSVSIILLNVIFIGCSMKPTETQVSTKSPLSATSTEIPFSGSTPTQTQTLITECQLSESSETSLEGGILFYEEDFSNWTTKIWLWSHGMTSPRLVLEKKLYAETLLSPDAKRLLWQEQENQFIVYNLDSKTRENFAMQPTWVLSGWTSDGRVLINVEYRMIYDKGFTSKDVYYDISTLSSEIKTKSFNLPGYPFDGTLHGPLDGFVVFDPSETLAFYSTNGIKESFVLLDTTNGEVLWKYKASSYPYPIPNWTKDGDKVSFAIYDDSHAIIYTLTRDGKSIENIGKGSLQRAIREIKWSPDGKHLYYSYWDTVSEGSGFILNIDTKETREICTPNFSFLDGYWLTDNQFAFIVKDNLELHESGKGELRLLNVENWSYKTIFKTSQKISSALDLPILGWTPIAEP